MLHGVYTDVVENCCMQNFLIFILSINSFVVLGQPKILIADSIEFDKYKIYIVDSSEELIFTDPSLGLTDIGKEQIGRNIPRTDRFELTMEDASLTDEYIRTNYAKALTTSYNKSIDEMFGHPEVYDTVQLLSQHEKTLKNVQQQNAIAESKLLPKNNRFMYGFTNPKGERLVYISFEPNYKLKYKKIKGTGEATPSNIIWSIVFNLDTEELGVRPKNW